MLYCDIHPREGESFCEAVIRTVPLRERVLSGLALKIVAIRLDMECRSFDNKPSRYNNPEELIEETRSELEKIRAMTNEEYERFDKGHV